MTNPNIVFVAAGPRHRRAISLFEIRPAVNRAGTSVTAVCPKPQTNGRFIFAAGLPG